MISVFKKKAMLEVWIIYLRTFEHFYIFIYFLFAGSVQVTREETTTSVSTLCFNGRKQEEKENLSLR